MREEIEPRIRVRPDGIDVIIRKAVFNDAEEIATMVECAECKGVGWTSIAEDGIAIMCQGCAGKGCVYDGLTRSIERFNSKYGLTHDGEWILVKE